MEKGYYIYKYYIGDELAYIGKARNPIRRYKEHLAQDEVYKDVTRIDLCKFESHSNMDIAEVYFIEKYKPHLNKLSKSEKPCEFTLAKEPEWKTYSVKELLQETYGIKKPSKAVHNVIIERRDIAGNETVRKMFKIACNDYEAPHDLLYDGVWGKSEMAWFSPVNILNGEHIKLEEVEERELRDVWGIGNLGARGRMSSLPLSTSLGVSIQNYYKPDEPCTGVDVYAKFSGELMSAMCKTKSMTDGLFEITKDMRFVLERKKQGCGFIYDDETADICHYEINPERKEAYVTSLKDYLREMA